MRSTGSSAETPCTMPPPAYLPRCRSCRRVVAAGYRRHPGRRHDGRRLIGRANPADHAELLPSPSVLIPTERAHACRRVPISLFGALLTAPPAGQDSHAYRFLFVRGVKGLRESAASPPPVPGCRAGYGAVPAGLKGAAHRRLREMAGSEQVECPAITASPMGPTMLRQLIVRPRPHGQGRADIQTGSALCHLSVRLDERKHEIFRRCSAIMKICHRQLRLIPYCARWSRLPRSPRRCSMGPSRYPSGHYPRPRRDRPCEPIQPHGYCG